MTYPFKPLSNAHEIAIAINDIPDHWSLVAVWEKSPKQENWQTNEKQSVTAIAELIIDGEQRRSQKTGNDFRWWASGYGLRLGDYSEGLIAIDIDGKSAIPILQAISGGKIPKTVRWTSGKEGRSQILFQVPEEYRSQLSDFNRKMITQWGDIECDYTMEGDRKKYNEGLELRYNRCQSVLPPSYHPTTGSYKWVRSPIDTPVSIAPQWLIDLLLKVKDDAPTGGTEPKWEKYKRSVSTGLVRSQDISEFLLHNVYPRLTPDQIFNWNGHNFRAFGKTLKGNPPWRASASGTSFHIWEANGQWCWQDKQLGCGGGAIAYRHMLAGGNGKPRGKEFIAIAKQLTEEAGLEFPAYTQKMQIELTIEDDLQDAIAKADELRSALTIYGTDEEKADLLHWHTKQWDDKLRPFVWAAIEKCDRVEIQRLMRLPIPDALPEIVGF